MSGIEARARMEAETKLVRRHRAEYDRVAGRRGHVAAVRALVKAHKSEYDQHISQAVTRQRSAAQQTVTAA